MSEITIGTEDVADVPGDLRDVTCSACGAGQQIQVQDGHLDTRLPEVAAKLTAGRENLDSFEGSDAEYLAHWAQIRWECTACSAYNTYRPPELDEWLADNGDRAAATLIVDARIADLDRQKTALLAGLGVSAAADSTVGGSDTAGAATASGDVAGT